MRILAADHDQDNLKVLSLKLESNGFDVVVAHDGEEALSQIRKQKPDLIILDVMMPKISGFQIARLVKFDENLKKIPLILLSARAQETDKTVGKEVGADLYITKPYDPEHLLKEVQRLLGTDAS